MKKKSARNTLLAGGAIGLLLWWLLQGKKGKGEGVARHKGAKPIAFVHFKVLPMRVEISVRADSSDTPTIVSYSNLEEALSQLPGLFEVIQTQIIWLKVDLNYKPMTNDQIRKVVELRLSQIPSANRTQVKVTKLH